MTPPAALEQQLCFALYAASRATVKAYRPHLDPLGLTYPQYLVLLVLWEHDAVSVSELGRRLHLDSGTLSPLLKRMETDGHLSRRRDADDGRTVTVHLTAAGRDVGRHADSMQRCLREAASHLTDDELATLLALTHKLLRDPNHNDRPSATTTPRSNP